MSVITQTPTIAAALQEIARTAKTLDDITAIRLRRWFDRFSWRYRCCVP